MSFTGAKGIPKYKIGLGCLCDSVWLCGSVWLCALCAALCACGSVCACEWSNCWCAESTVGVRCGPFVMSVWLLLSLCCRPFVSCVPPSPGPLVVERPVLVRPIITIQGPKKRKAVDAESSEECVPLRVVACRCV
jgi:hypothetical protein